jgi:hypothetical protein
MANRLSRWADGLTALAFVAALCAPLSRWLLEGRPDQSVAREQRTAAPWPAAPLGESARRAFPRAFERWFDDRFPFRRELLQLNNRLLWSVLGSIPDDSMVRGKAGWLYLAGTEAMGLYRGHDPFEPAELDAWIEAYDGFRDWLAARDCLYLLLLGPDKQGIYPEFLPDWVQREGPRTRTDQFFEALAARSEIPVIDLRPTLLAHKGDGLLYFPHGTHWNDRGSWYGYLALIEQLKARFPVQRPLPRSAFKEYDRRLVDRLWIGDTWFERWHLDQQIRQEAVVLEYQNPLTFTLVPDSLRRGPSGLVEGRTRNSLDFLPKALLLSDSYGEWLWTFLAHHFREFVSEKSARFPLGMIERERPDVVLQVRVERFLMAPLERPELDPEELALCRAWNAAPDLSASAQGAAAREPFAALPAERGLLRLEFEPGEPLEFALLPAAPASEALPLRLGAERRFLFVRGPAQGLGGARLVLPPAAEARLLGWARR